MCWLRKKKDEQLDLNQVFCDDLKADEGFSRYAYNDHLTYLTIGYGRLIDRRKGGGISEAEAEYLLKNDIVRSYNELGSKLDYFTSLPFPVQRALLNMAFQLGINGLLKFKNTLKYISQGDYEAAADNALKSKWAKQTPERAIRVTDWIREGK